MTTELNFTTLAKLQARFDTIEDGDNSKYLGVLLGNDDNEGD